MNPYQAGSSTASEPAWLKNPKRTSDVLRKPDNLTSYRQRIPRFWTILDSIYARARVNVNLELSRSGRS
jgi:hypothetical protein